MRSIDTNIVVRLLLRDDASQIASVDALVEQGDLFVPYTVLVEAEWVLRAVYKLDRAAIAALLGSLGRIEGIAVPDTDGLAWACERYSAGADFTDMIHLLASEGEPFLTFDRHLVKFAGEGGAPCQAQLVA